MTPHCTNGFVNGCPVRFEYNSPASASTLNVDFKEGAISLSIPNSELIALLEQGNGKYVLLFSGDEKKLSGSNVLNDIPNYVPGQLQVVTPPQELVDSLLFPREKCPEWLDITGGRSELTVIVSTGGGVNGKSKAEVLYETLVRPVLKEIGLFEGSAGEVESSSAKYSVFYTTSQYSIEEFLKKFHTSHSQRPTPTLLLLSGDTSLFEVLNYLPNPLPPSLPKLYLSILPTGTGNALCSSIYLEYHPLSSLLLGSPQNLPLFHAQFSPDSLLLSQSGKHPIPGRGLYGAVVLSWAFHASLVADSDAPSYRAKYPGTQRFQVAARENLTPRPHLYNGRISVQRQPNGPWEDLQKELLGDRGYWYFLATLVSRLEATFLINPLGEPLDGKLRVVHFSKLPTPAGADMEANTADTKSIIQAMEAAYDQGKHVELPGVGYERDGVEGVRVQVDEEDYVFEGEGAAERGRERWRRICIDGAIVELQRGGWVEIRRIPQGLEGVKLVWRS